MTIIVVGGGSITTSVIDSINAGKISIEHSDDNSTSYSNNYDPSPQIERLSTEYYDNLNNFNWTEDSEKLLRAEESKKALYQWKKLELDREGCEKSFLKNNFYLTRQVESKRCRRTWKYRGRATFY